MSSRIEYPILEEEEARRTGGGLENEMLIIGREGEREGEKKASGDLQLDTDTWVVIISAGIFSLLQLAIVVILVIRFVDIAQSAQPQKWFDYIIVSVLFIIFAWKLSCGVLLIYNKFQTARKKYGYLFTAMVIMGAWNLAVIAFFIYMIVMVDPYEKPARAFAIIMLVLTLIDFAAFFVPYFFFYRDDQVRVVFYPIQQQKIQYIQLIPARFF